MAGCLKARPGTETYLLTFSHGCQLQLLFTAAGRSIRQPSLPTSLRGVLLQCMPVQSESIANLSVGTVCAGVLAQSHLFTPTSLSFCPFQLTLLPYPTALPSSPQTALSQCPCADSFQARRSPAHRWAVSLAKSCHPACIAMHSTIMQTKTGQVHAPLCAM